MKNSKGFASLVLAATMVFALSAETHRPGNSASVPFRIADRQQVIMAVFVNHSGPTNFTKQSEPQRTLAALPPQGIKIASVRIPRSSFLKKLVGSLTGNFVGLQVAEHYPEILKVLNDPQRILNPL
jgi:hypothetical protein